MINNKKAYFDYEIIEEEVAGIMLLGSELKPLRKGKASIQESYIHISENGAWIRGMFIESPMNAYSHEEKRERKLLLTKKQLHKWNEKVRISGFTIVPLAGYFDEKHRFKLKIALSKGKKTFNKKDSIKEKDIKKETKRILKYEDKY